MLRETTRIGLFGRGRLGSMVAALVERSPGLELAWVAGRGDHPGTDADVALDASNACVVADHLSWAIESGTALVIGTTGWDASILEPIAGLALESGIMVAPNFSMAVALMRRAALALGRLASRDEEADLSVVERHHSGKADSPSGTAKLLAAALGEGSGRHDGWILDRAEAGKINVASLRSGRAIGYHELRYEAPLETIVFSHEALDRGLYARGAIDAILWMKGRRGVYSFDDMAAELIDELFSTRTGRQPHLDIPSRPGRGEAPSLWKHRALGA